MARVTISCCLLVWAVVGPPPAAADDERSLTDPTAWWWLHGATPQQVADLIASEGARLVDLEIEDDNPLTFSAAFVHNTGVHAKNWWWRYGDTVASLSSFVGANDARIIDLERYETASGTRWAAVMVHNVGDDAKAWWWYVQQTTAQMSTHLSTNDARFVDVETYDIGGTRYVDGVMIRNAGADAAAWWWWVGASGAFVIDRIDQHDARILDLETYINGAGQRVYDVVLKHNATGTYWWWWTGANANSVTDLINQHGARIADIQAYYVGGVKRFAAMMLNNSNELTTNIATQLGYGTDGATGFYLREVNGPLLANINEGRAFEPASTLKVIHHLHAMREVMFGGDELHHPVTYSTNQSGSCPLPGPPFTTETLETTLSSMMWVSDNSATEGITQRYGAAAIEATARNIALMPDTELDRVFGCGGPPFNATTLLDLSSLYTRVVNGNILFGQAREDFYHLMQSETSPVTWWFTEDLRNVVYQEAASLGLPSSAADEYWDQVRLAWKPGGDTFCGPCIENRSVAGWVQLPRCDAPPVDYVFGLFIDGGTDAAHADSRLDVTSELFRGEIRDGLEQCPVTVAESTVPTALLLEPASPNPFHESTRVSFSLDHARDVRLSIYNAQGQHVRTVVDARLPAGPAQAEWDGRDRQGRRMPPGVYVMRLDTNGRHTSTGKVVVSAW